MGNRAKARRARTADTVSRQRVEAEGLAVFLKQLAALEPDPARIGFICIGTDCSTGDSYGPLVGSLLAQAGWRVVIGTLEQPCDSDRYEAMKAGIPEGLTTIAIDACLGKKEEKPGYIVGEGPLYPGHALGKRLGPAGDYSIAGIVGRAGVKPYWTIQHASLYEAMGMARDTAAAIQAAWHMPAVHAIYLR
ncbi:spore protease YyaC [Paenibacillus sp. R14(2021)]|uniref:spore protease YyaC n=1 Tax=Paenibacillus sp. R14(2021) TaxID=2859228 RepID=UPI001C6119BC|nr:spore protease YyaC [Paenibacillus sp. R14(2021)]